MTELLLINDPSLDKVPPYEYRSLTGSKRKIRLLKLQSGTIEGKEIFCELTEANYDNTFHVPTDIEPPLNHPKPAAAHPRRRLTWLCWFTELCRLAFGSPVTWMLSWSSRLASLLWIKQSGNIPTDTETTGDHRHSVAQLHGRWLTWLCWVDVTSRLLSWLHRLASNPWGKQSQNRNTEDDYKRILLEEYQKLFAKRIDYEALSWCWGTDTPEYAVKIRVGTQTFKLAVRKQLALALKYLRLPDKSRTLWIDAICIDQTNPSERNHQVQMMSRVYTRATEVCIWLGDGDASSHMAINFIRDKITKLRNFDELCTDKTYTNQWKALMVLMQREWFSRRWVVQEIALANTAVIHCGADSISWKDFAIAVELFVEVETATHRLSEIMQKDEKFHYIPGWFEYVSELGASLLVQATGRIFRAQLSPLEDQEGTNEEISIERMRRFQTIDPLDRRSLLSLEYLVSTLYIFEATDPRDAVYAMLAISRDAAPFIEPDSISTSDPDGDQVRLIMSACEPFLEEKPFEVDYRRPYSIVCKDFVEFIIKRKMKSDPAQALDILCRPWAMKPKSQRPPRTQRKPHGKAPNDEQPHDPEWFSKREDTKLYFARSEKKVKHSKDWQAMKKYFPDHAGQDESWKDDTKDLDLPTWVAKKIQAPISLHHAPGIDMQKTSRSNADPLVGTPQDGHRNYNAAQGEPVRPWRFRRRPRLKHHSFYVEGFVVDQVVDVRDASQGGNIPKSWLDLAGWNSEDQNKDPPAQLWRTLVGDRGRDNQNPPYYYARACRETVHKGGIASGRADTAALINNERNSIVAQFCRRVHAVIWNRHLFNTEAGRLGLAGSRDDATRVQKGDKICVLYGCTVPVVLRRRQKTKGDVEEEAREDRFELLRKVILDFQTRYFKKQRRRAKEVLEGYSRNERKEVQRATRQVNKKLKQEVKDRKQEAREAAETWEKLNKPDEWYEFRGECYLHGMMDGEAIRQRLYTEDGRQEETKDRIFELR